MTDHNFEHREVQGEESPTHETGAISPRTAEEIFSVDDRLIVLERSSKEYRLHLVNLEELLINQMVALGILEVVFAVFLAFMVWSHYKKEVA